MEPRNHRMIQRSSTDDNKRFTSASNERSMQRNNRDQKDPSGNQRKGTERRINWENDLYERQSS